LLKNVKFIIFFWEKILLENSTCRRNVSLFLFPQKIKNKISYFVKCCCQARTLASRVRGENSRFVGRIISLAPLLSQKTHGDVKIASSFQCRPRYISARYEIKRKAAPGGGARRIASQAESQGPFLSLSLIFLPSGSNSQVWRNSRYTHTYITRYRRA
jgi:hypothetical protein